MTNILVVSHVNILINDEISDLKLIISCQPS